jgi:hypothetical protein
MPRWMKPEEECPNRDDLACGDRIVIIVVERSEDERHKTPRLVILEVTETGWTSSDPACSGYVPEDGILWSMEKDVCAVAHVLGLV